MKDQWIIGICSSAVDGVCLIGFCGTEDEIRSELVKLVQEDKGNDDTYDHGTETPDEVAYYGGEMYAYGSYLDYHIDYTAKKLKDIL